MFTGIVEEIGTVEGISFNGKSNIIKIKASKVLEGTAVGDSIAVNGICLTVTSILANEFDADIMPETLNRTYMKDLHKGDKVNLERAMLAGGRFGGHVVSGHIDGTGKIIDISSDDNAVWYTIETSKVYRKDVQDVFKNECSSGFIGFRTEFSINDIDEGIYKIGIIIADDMIFTKSELKL